MKATDLAIRQHMNSAARLMELVLSELQAESPSDARIVADAYGAGAMLQLKSVIARSGIAILAVELIEPNGTVHTISSCELQREVVQ